MNYQDVVAIEQDLSAPQCLRAVPSGLPLKLYGLGFLHMRSRSGRFCLDNLLVQALVLQTTGIYKGCRCDKLSHVQQRRFGAIRVFEVSPLIYS